MTDNADQCSDRIRRVVIDRADQRSDLGLWLALIGLGIGIVWFAWRFPRLSLAIAMALIGATIIIKVFPGTPPLTEQAKPEVSDCTGLSTGQPYYCDLITGPDTH